MTDAFIFDTLIDRHHTASDKWDRYRGTDILPMWLADMDFLSPPEVMAALHRRVDHGVFGYSRPSEDLIQAALAHFSARYGWTVAPEWLVWLPGLVTGLNVACRAVGEKGDAVLSHVPIYPPFLTAPRHQERTLITVPLTDGPHRWEIDFDRLEQAVTPRTRLFLLCNPHNPAGRVFTRDELTGLVSFCEKHDLVICSDEIHCDLVLDTACSHIPTATLGDDAARRTITLMAPSKTYNIAGLGCSLAIIPDVAIRKRFKAAMAGIVPDVNLLAFTAAGAAYQHGEPWRKALLAYLRKNRDVVQTAISTMPGLEMKPVEATYLAWIDTRTADLGNPSKFFEKAGVGLNNGSDFGLSGFVRLNFGCPRVTLETGLNRMARAMETIR
jgi:cystathionine beta-lyase